MAQQFLLILIGLTLALVGQKSDAFLGFGSKSPAVIDSNPRGTIGIDQICGSKNHLGQISRVATIRWLKGNLDTLTKDNEATDDQIHCLSQYREPVDRLVEIFDASESDACNDKHITLVEKFHRDHVESHLLNYKDASSNRNRIPEPLKWFFVQYTNELTHVCRQNFLDNLELMGKSSSAEYNSVISGISGKFIKAMQTVVQSPETIGSDRDFVLIWNMVVRFNRKAGLKREINGISMPEASDPVKLRLKMRSPAEFKLVQEKCRNHLKPIYYETAFSPMRLIDMGYSTPEDRDLPAIDKQFQNWYSIAQACEYLLPIIVYEDPSLQTEQMVVISKDEEEQLIKVNDQANSAPGSSLEPTSFTKTPATLIGVDFELDFIKNPSKLLAQVRTNLKSRMRRFKKLMIKSVKKLVGKAQLKNLIISRKSKDGKRFIKSSTDPKEAEKALSEEEKSDESLERHVRSASDDEKKDGAEKDKDGAGKERKPEEDDDDDYYDSDSDEDDDDPELDNSNIWYPEKKDEKEVKVETWASVWFKGFVVPAFIFIMLLCLLALLSG